MLLVVARRYDCDSSSDTALCNLLLTLIGIPQLWNGIRPLKYHLG